MTEKHQSLTGLTPAEIAAAVGPAEKYRSKQIADWIRRGAVSFDEMKNLPAAFRERLKTSFKIRSTELSFSDTDADNTLKIALKLHDGLLIEAVLLADENGRTTACLSSQAGCAMGCTFCRTGKMGFKRNLSASEIIEQFMHLRSLRGDINNIVYMGMGEPFMNTDEVIKSLNYFTSSDGLGLSARRITVSTCGIIEGIRRLGDEAPAVRLAVSLVSADKTVRTEIMPVTKTNDLKGLKKALVDYQASGGRRITLECAVIGGVNDSRNHAAAIADWADGLNVNINVIPWNPASEIDYREPAPRRLEEFCRELDRRDIPYTRRFRRGRGLNAACGQLATGLEKKAGNQD